MLDMTHPAGGTGTRTAPGWKAELGIGFAFSHGRTILSHRHHRGPLTIQRPFYPEGDEVCHLYALHPPGGIVGGDSLLLEAESAADSHGLVTTPSATKFYRSAGPEAVQTQNLRVHGNASLEWLPLETIVYPGANARLDTRIELTGNATFFGWDIICLGLPASSQPFEEGRFDQSLKVYRDGDPIFMEHALYPGGSDMLHEKWGLGGATVFGTFIATGGSRESGDRIRDAVDSMKEKGLFSLTRFDGITVCRALGDNAFKVRDLLSRAWAELRPESLGRTDCPPRIWNT